jgi:plasmid maintenance system antidote protein VapI
MWYIGIFGGLGLQPLNGHSSISNEMAVRLSLGFGCSPESWLLQQNLYDLAQTKISLERVFTSGVLLRREAF